MTKTWDQLMGSARGPTHRAGSGHQQARSGLQPGRSAAVASRVPVTIVSWYIHDRFDALSRTYHLKESTADNRPSKTFDVSVARWMLMTKARKVPLTLTAKIQGTEVLKMITTTAPNKPDNVNYSFVKVSNTEVPLGVKTAAQQAARVTAVQAVERARKEAAEATRKQAVQTGRRGSHQLPGAKTPRSQSRPR